ncbi:MAG: succinate dehydrogenase, hydrophobic membrane anchor protein, partial [Betaproteobacteria bacterium]|nr:succinate dehydrogenase, hydrophobic membrane anchor protein [Betaproteobacteria bacterium]
TGAHYGLRDWLMQRITAVVMALYALAMAGWLLLHPGFNYDAWIALFSSSVVRTVSLLFLLAVYCHAWVGVRNIVMDYVKPAGRRLIIYVAVILALLLCVIWSVQILWGF